MMATGRCPRPVRRPAAGPARGVPFRRAGVIAGAVLAGLAGLVTLAGVLVPAARAESVAFYYGRELPFELVDVYQRVVVDADALARGGVDLAALRGRRGKLHAYLSVGELGHDGRPSSFQDDWIIAENPAWKTNVVDLTSPGWQRYLVEDRMAALWRRGYRGFFLDTLDSYTLGPAEPARREAQRKALIALIRAMHRRYPGATLIANRGFEVLPEIAPLLAGVVAESLFERWDPTSQRHVPVPDADRDWLTKKLSEVRTRHGLPVTVIDYLPPDQRDKARATARAITALGFDPWVADKDLVSLGAAEPTIVLRRVLVLYDGKYDELARSRAHTLLAPILEHEGYVPELRDVRDPLPREPLRYAAIATWFEHPLDEVAGRYCRWLVGALDRGLRVAIFAELGFEPPAAVLDRLGLAMASRPARRPAAAPARPPALTLRTTPLIGFEARPITGRTLGPGLVARDPALVVHLRVEDGSGPVRDPVLVGPWGGLAAAPYLVRQGYAGALFWVIDPFAFVRAALASELMPVPDVTTEDGNRLLFVHIAGEGAERPAELRGGPLASDVIRTLVAASRLPHSTDSSEIARGLAGVVVRAPGLVGPGSHLTRAHPSLTRLRPLLVPDVAQDRFPVYQPIADEDAFRAEDGSAPASFRRVIETFELTDGARRLTPIALFYHAYSGATAGGAAALRDIYAWLASQRTRPVYSWEYADRARAWYRVVLARHIDDGAWHVYGLGALRTVRIDPAMGWPDLSSAPALVALADRPGGRYASFTGGADVRFRLIDTPPARPVVVSSNAAITTFEVIPPGSRQRGAQRASTLRIRLRARGHVPVSLIIGNLPDRPCVLAGRGVRTRGVMSSGASLAHAQRFDLSALDSGAAVVECL